MSEQELPESPTEEEIGGEEGKKSSRLPKLLMLGAIVAVFGMTILLLWGGRYEMARVRPGFPAPEFSFPDLDDKMVSLSDYKGKVVLLNLWSITCPPCIEEVPYLENLYQKMKDNKDFHLLTVVTNRGETKEKIIPFMKKYGLNFHVLVDYRKEAWRRYKITGWPETFLIGKDGIIIEKYVGPQDWDSAKFIEKLTRLAEGA